MEVLSLANADRIVGSAVQYLVEGQEFKAAEALLLCQVESLYPYNEVDLQTSYYLVVIALRGPVQRSRRSTTTSMT
jgi:hypothetical protein